MAIGTLYCDLSDVQRLLSIEGVNLRLDDDPSIYPYVLDEGSRWLDDYLLGAYSESVLSNNQRARYYAAVFSATLFCERRGNPVARGIQRKLERNIERLDLISQGSAALPGAVRRRTGVPTLSQPRVVLSPFPRTVIEPARSGAGAPRPTDYAQRRDRTERAGDYSI